MADPRIRLRIDFGPRCSLGPGKVALLEAIDATGSLTQAARRERMSYRRAWLLLEDVNSSFAEAATRSATGGRGGGGMHLTPFGRRLIEDFRGLERRVAALGKGALGGLAGSARATRRAAGAPRSLKRAAARR